MLFVCDVSACEVRTMHHVDLRVFVHVCALDNVKTQEYVSIVSHFESVCVHF